MIIQRRIFDKGKPTEEIGLYSKHDRLIGILQDGHPETQFVRGEDEDCWGQVLGQLGMTTKAIRERDKMGIAAYAWGWPEPTGEDGDYDEDD